MILQPRNWEKFQHYKNRRPPWIRLHRSLLDDYDFHCLPCASRALAPCLWLLASEYEDAKIDATLEQICFRLRMSQESFLEAVTPLIKNGYFKSDSTMLAACKHDASTETEAEAEAEVAPPPRKRTNGRSLAAPTTPVWEAYAAAYQRRYGIEPVRNAKVNSQLKLFLQRIPQGEASMIAASYVLSQNRYYCQRGHSIDCLLADAEKLRTEYLTGNSTMFTEAAQADSFEARRRRYNRLIEKFEKEVENDQIIEGANHASNRGDC